MEKKAEESSAEGPTWIDPIKSFFTEEDIGCMKVGGPGDRFDLSKYSDVKSNADQIYGITLSQVMPPETSRKWDAEKSATFWQWMEAGCPFGTQPAEHKAEIVPMVAGGRERKSITELVENYPEEWELVKKAFEGIMSRDPSDHQSYFYLGGIHGLPGASYCWHHFSGFLPWHRQYSWMFEEALRSVEGCENVTLPYWDQVRTNGVPPQALYEPPFDKFTYPIEVHKDPDTPHNRGPGTSNPFTFRSTREQMEGDELGKNRTYIIDMIAKSMMRTEYEEFAQYHGTGDQVEHAHDQMHNALGGGVYKSDPQKIICVNPHTEQVEPGEMYWVEWTGFDPIFWFMHCDYDRLFWEWQRSRAATTETGLIRTFRNGDKESLYLDAKMHPWTKDDGFDEDVVFRQMIDGRGVTYSPGSHHFLLGARQRPAWRHMNARLTVRPVEVGAEALVVVHNVDRTKIPGSFSVNLYYKAHRTAESEIVGCRFFFQRMDPENCDTCNEHKLIDFRFHLYDEPVTPGVHFEVRVFTWDKEIPLRTLGDPTISVFHQLNPN